MELRIYKQQNNQPQLDVVILKNGDVLVAGEMVKTEREKALANIILRLNAYAMTFDKYLET